VGEGPTLLPFFHQGKATSLKETHLMTVLELINILEGFEDTLEVYIPDGQHPDTGFNVTRKATDVVQDKQYGVTII